MELFNEMITHILLKYTHSLLLGKFYRKEKEILRGAKAAVELESYEALKMIKTVIEDEKLTDFECIEEIVCIFEEIGSDGGKRHYFNSVDDNAKS